MASRGNPIPAFPCEKHPPEYLALLPPPRPNFGGALKWSIVAFSDHYISTELCYVQPVSPPIWYTPPDKPAIPRCLVFTCLVDQFEELIASKIEQTKDIPEALSEAGKIGMPHGEIMRQIGQLFLLRMNINLVGNVLDSPELFWDYPDLKPMYEAARSYLELPQRIDLLNARVEVLQDMLKLLKESVTSRHGERLEQIVIVLIGIEILLGVITIVVDLFSTA